MEQSAPRRDVLDQVDDACPPGLPAQGIDGLLDALLVLGGQARGQRLRSTGATGNGRDLVDLSKT